MFVRLDETWSVLTHRRSFIHPYIGESSYLISLYTISSRLFSTHCTKPWADCVGLIHTPPFGCIVRKTLHTSRVIAKSPWSSVEGDTSTVTEYAALVQWSRGGYINNDDASQARRLFTGLCYPQPQYLLRTSAANVEFSCSQPLRFLSLLCT